MELTEETYASLRAHIQRLCGLNLRDDRRYLIRDRLGKLVHQHALTSFEGLARRLGEGQCQRLETEVVESILTGETSFFRDAHVFSVIERSILPALLPSPLASGPPLRILSAGVSTGQEAYSLAMLAYEQGLRAGSRGDFTRYKVIGTDISSRALAVASAGLYHRRDLDRGLDRTRQLTYFEPADDRFKVKSELRSSVEFIQVNFKQPLTLSGPFDLICCRNVMIYFDEALRQRLCDQFYRLLKPRGWLIIGAAENLYGLSTGYESVQFEGNVFCYQRRE